MLNTIKDHWIIYRVSNKKKTKESNRFYEQYNNQSQVDLKILNIEERCWPLGQARSTQPITCDVLKSPIQRHKLHCLQQHNSNSTIIPTPKYQCKQSKYNKNEKWTLVITNSRSQVEIWNFPTAHKRHTVYPKCPKIIQTENMCLISSITH